MVYWFVGLPFGYELPIPTSLPDHPDQVIDVKYSGAAAPDLLVLGLVVVARLLAPLAPNRFNTGIPTGTRNNLLVVDLDVKDDGVTEFDKYIALHGEPQTSRLKPQPKVTTIILTTPTLMPIAKK